jgi:hypothetical protein
MESFWSIIYFFKRGPFRRERGAGHPFLTGVENTAY